MGHFRAISKKKRIKKRLISYLILLGLFIILVKWFYSKLNLSEENVITLTQIYMGGKQKNQSALVMQDVNPPSVYIYNTHQTESYKSYNLQAYNIEYTVMLASHALASYLEDYNINSIVETNLISDVLKNNNLKYRDSYKASRTLLEKAFINNSNLNFFIDLHRDSSVYDKTTCIIDNKKYAKILFVVGLEHDNYERNLETANKLNELIKNYNKDLSRGIMKKEGPGVNGIYNQDFNKNVVLIELGGQYNSFEEANNTLKVLAKILANYLKEEYEKEKSI